MACSYLDDFDPLVDDLTTSADLLVLADGHSSPSFLHALKKLHSLESYPKEWSFAGVFLFFLGNEEEERKFVSSAWMEALLILAPAHTQAIHYERWNKESEEGLSSILLPLLKRK